MLFVVYFQKMVEKGEKLKNSEIKVVKDRSDEDEVEVVRKKVKRANLRPLITGNASCKSEHEKTIPPPLLG